MTFVLVAVVLVLVVLGLVLLQAFLRSRDRRRFPPPGRLVDVGGYRLHTTVVGDDGPVVVLVQGLSGIGLGWGDVPAHIEPFARVVTYDRAGAGWSDAHRGRRTCADMAAELRVLLSRIGIPAPFVLVGQSLGGHIVRLFAAQYPEDVAGLVLVDVTNEGVAVDRLVRRNLASIVRGNLVALTESLLTRRSVPKAVVRLGVLRALIALRRPRLLAEILAAVPDHLRPAFVAVINRPDYIDAFTDEIAGLAASQEQVAATRSRMPDIPVAVLTAGIRGVVARDEWTDALREQARAVTPFGDGLARLTHRGRHTVLDDSDHMVSVRKPEAVAEAVRWVIESRT